MTRQERVEELIKQEVSEILREKVSDPRIGFVSVTAVNVSPDLENASIFVSILGEEKQKAEAMKGLYSATKFIRGELGHRLELRLTPKIRFMRDDSIERGSRVLGLINKLEHEKLVPGNKKRPQRR
ncbi:ribosome-binding factor A [candidate division WOR-1 bacterium RIFCSPHIGHO2_01_FULL_53_15]|uniref:Ribosome-binding factor A n=1 Tax=candidate division WOR-1 bacterium RIFCSPHIGHO2_01_FULL_53_15 TaxID=1802564 RepID=A0A1F4Q4I2_UNCSA|nr:MAG: ribosome-binding factor A [candidate division WOR-1 bacterium RIFCSPHIGHO2_01_FULL_53_15]OGC10586.1 MAG: ribosome-binding factor A [candidate division WOR-1 bacterium RIFCSPHIGHO2_02_FULL_53_26]